MRRVPQQLPFDSFLPHSTWVAPRVSDLPSWKSVPRACIDIETRDPDLKTLGIGVRRDGDIIGASFAFEDGAGFYLPWGHVGEGNLNRESCLQYLIDQAAVFEGVLTGANLPYDLDYLAENGIIFKRAEIRDIQVAEPIINEHRMRYGLDPLCEVYNIPGKDETLLREAAAACNVNPKSGLYLLHPKFVGRYAEQDAHAPLRILRKQERIIEDQGLWKIYMLECALTPVLIKMRRRGVPVDQDRLAMLTAHVCKMKEAMCSEINRHTPIKLAPTDLKKATAIGPILEFLGLKVPRTAKTKQFSIDKAYLDSIDHPIADMLKEARGMDTMHSFCKGLPRYLTPAGRIHATTNQLKTDREDGGGSKGTVSGRCSCVVASTPVKTKRGMVPIIDVAIGDMVWTHEGRWRPVTRHLDQGVEEVYSVCLSNGLVLTCTSDHRLLGPFRTWATVGEIIESFKELDIGTRESSKCNQGVQADESVAVDEGDRNIDGSNRGHDFVHFKTLYAGSGTAGAEKTKALRRKNRLKESDAWEDRDGAPQLDRGMQRRTWVPNLSTQREEAVCTQGGNGESTRVGGTADDPACTPHKLRQCGQSTRQPSVGDSHRAQNNSLYAVGDTSVIIEEIHYLGNRQVYDLTVDEDHSYETCGVFSHNCNSPNLQQQPIRHKTLGAVWRGIYKPEPGCKWTSCDYSAQEPRLTIHYAELTKCRGAKEAGDRFRNNPTEDAYAHMMKVTGMDRKTCKVIVLGSSYGMGGAKLCDSLGYPVEREKDRDGEWRRVAGPQGQAVIDKFHEEVPFIRELAQKCVRKAKNIGVITTLLGRGVHFEKDDLGNFEYTYKALNRLIQGGSADQMKQAMVNADKLGIKIQLQVHDELDFSSSSPAQAEELAEVMRDAVPLLVPSVVDTESGDSWGEINEEGRIQCQEFYKGAP